MKADAKTISVTHDDADKNKVSQALLRTYNYQIVQEACNYAKTNSRVVAIVGEPGFGKTVSLRSFQKSNRNVFLITARPSMKQKTFRFDLLRKVDPAYADSQHLNMESAFEYNHRNLFFILTRISNALRDCDQPLICIDEAGKLTDKMLSFFHELRDDAPNCGFVLAGPPYWKDNMFRWAAANKSGIPEVLRRINLWKSLLPPTANEVKQFCLMRGIKDEQVIRNLILTCQNYGQLENEIELLQLEYHKLKP